MKKWLPYLVAAVLGIGVAFVAFNPGGKEEAPAASEKEPKKKKTVRTSVDMGADGFDLARTEDEAKTPAEVVAEGRANPLPPPGTLRPLNESEIKHQARLARPYNQRYAYVAAFWNRSAQLIGPTDMELARECSEMARYMRDQGNLDDRDLDVGAAFDKERALVAKLRAADPGNTELDGVLGYIEETMAAVVAGEDPTKVVKPHKKAAQGG